MYKYKPLIFCEGKKTLGAGTGTNNKLNSHMTPAIIWSWLLTLESVD